MKITNWLFHHPLKLGLLVFILLLLFYASSIPMTNVGYADSDEFLAVAQNWGIAHPPGYSLYVGVLNLFMKLPLPLTTPAYRAHLITAIASAMAIAIAIPLMRLLYIKILPKKNRNPIVFIIITLTTILTVATSKQLWLYSQITEKYIFAAPLIMGLIYIGLVLSGKINRSANIHHLGFGILFGLMLGHHQSLVFLAPFWIYCLYQSFRHNQNSIKNLSIAIGGLLLGLTITILLLWTQIARQDSQLLSWYSGDGLQGLVNIVTRQDFRGQIYATGVETDGYLPNNLTVSRFLTDIGNYLKNLGDSFAWWIFLPLIVAVRQLYKRDFSLLLTIFLPFFFIGPILAGYLGWPSDNGTQAITQRFYLFSYFALLPLIFIGLTTILTRLHQAVKIMTGKQIIGGTLLSIAPILLAVQAITLYPQISLKEFDLVSRLYSTILTEVKPDSIVTCYSDTACFALLYEQSVNRLRPDVQVVPMAHPLVHNQLKRANLQRFTYTQNPFMLFDIVTSNVGKKPVYAVDTSHYYFNILGLRNGFMYYIPNGYVGELTRAMPLEIPEATYQLSADYLSKPAPAFDLYRQFLFESLAQTHISNAFVHLKRGERAQAQQLLNTAGNLSSRLLPTLATNTHASRLEIEQTMPDSKFSPGSRVIDPQLLLDDVPKYIQAGRNGSAYAALLGAISIDPESVPARILLAQMYEQAGDYIFAKLEYQHVLVLDPNNQEALASLMVLP
jgi:tetratricopeptide (TPR) repeat protein